MSKTRQIILISLLNIAIMLWLTFIYSIWTHKEDPSLINYQSPEEKMAKEEKKTKKDKDFFKEKDIKIETPDIKETQKETQDLKVDPDIK